MPGERRRLADTLLLLRWVVPVVIITVVAIHQLVQLLAPGSLSPGVQFLANVLIYGVSGAVLSWIGITLMANDLVEHEQADAAARQREQYFTSITTESADAIISLNTDGIIQSWSRGAEQIFGYSSDEAVGHHFALLVPTDLKEKGEIELLAEMVERDGYIRNHITQRVTKDGRRVWVDITRTLITEHDGRVVGFSAIMRDITERVHGEEAIRELNRQLERRVAERTRDLEQASQQLRQRNVELEQANRELQELDRLKSDFISMVSHELRAPLTNINGALELMRGEAPDGSEESRRRLLATATDQAARLTRFVQGVLNVSRIEAGALTFQFADVAAPQLVSKVVSDYSAHCQSHRFVICDAVAPACHVWADRDRLEEVLINLVDNAVKYSPAGGEISLGCRVVSDLSTLMPGGPTPRGSFGVISVTDQGIGVPAADSERIFDRFYRVDSQDNREVYGHGLGLYIARRLIEGHGGRIWMEGLPGGGSRFSIAVPLAAPAAANGGAPS